MTRRRQLVFSYAQFCAIAWVGCSSALAQAPPSPVLVGQAKTQLLQERRLVTGELRPVRRARVASQEEGLLLRVQFEEGMAVTQGQVLAELDSERLALELQQTRAELQVSQALIEERDAEYQWRQRELDNYRASAERSASNPKELRDAESNAAIARARLAAAQAQQTATSARADLLKKRIADTRITAPFDGVIVAKLVESGEWLASGGRVAEMISTGPIDVWLDVPQQYAPALMEASASISVRIDPTGQIVDSSELRTIPQVQPNARTFSLIARLPSSQGVAAGMTVSAWVPTGQEAQQLTVPRDAVLRNAQGAFVYVVRTQGESGSVAVPADVQVLFGTGDRFVVRSTALSDGESVVVEGNERLSPMSPVRPTVAPQTPQSNAASQ